MAVKSGLPGSANAAAQSERYMRGTADGSTAPVIILSYGESGAQLVQQVLADGTDLACTAGSGILPLCEAAAVTWAQIENRPTSSMSRLAISSIRTLISTQLTVVLASGDKRRWCELATSAPSAAQVFLQIFRAARFICVHRACIDVISAAVAAQPWGLAGPVISRFTDSYPGNSVAAVAAYWAWATEQLLAFEAANPQASSRVRYEDVVADADHALDTVKSCLHLNQETQEQRLPRLPEPAREDQAGGHLKVPVDMIPTELRKRIEYLHAELGYPALNIR